MSSPEDRPQAPIVRLEQVSVRHAATGRVIVSDVGFTLARGRCLGIVGESGSGKTLICRTLLGLLPPALAAEGQAFFGDIDMIRAAPETARRLRGTGIGTILQQPMSAFDPLYTLGAQFVETFQDKLGLGKEAARALGREKLAQMNLPATVMRSYPHQLSGGMLQRCMIALTLALKAELIVADEPTTALDAQNQFQVLECFRQLRERLHVTLIIVSHDLGAVQMLADHILVMDGGRCVEAGEVKTVFNAPRHEYTRYLVRTRLALTRGFQRALGGGHASA